MYSVLIFITTSIVIGNLFFYFLTLKTDIFEPYLIQQGKSNKHLHKHYKLILKNVLLMFATFLLTFSYIIYTSNETFVEQFPSIFEIVWQNILCLIVDDFYIYLYHRLLHTRFFFKNMHHIHHRAHNPNLFDFIYSHSIEPIIGSFALLSIFITIKPHIITISLAILIRQLHENEIHSGYDFPWSMSNLIPGLMTSKGHNLHHSKIHCNYGNTFIFWDYIFRTLDDY